MRGIEGGASKGIRAILPGPPRGVRHSPLNGSMGFFREFLGRLAIEGPLMANFPKIPAEPSFVILSEAKDLLWVAGG